MSTDDISQTTRKTESNSESHNNENSTTISPILLNSIKLLIIAVFVYPLLHYTVLSRSSSPPIHDATTEAPPPHNASSHDHAPEPLPSARIVRVRERVKQPTCSLSQHLESVLSELCEEVAVRGRQCSPEDVDNLEKHKVPKWLSSGQQGEPRGTIVGCIAAGLLLTSLGAACLELYKAKSQAAGGGKTAKNPMSRKCSLADLTVLKHNRKELVRRESVLEMAAPKQLGWRPPLYRRCSFPVGPAEVGNYGCSYGTGQPQQESRRTSVAVEPRRLSVINESRRNSMDFHSRKPSIIDGKAHSFDESPERRHWTRLVHRH